LAKIDTSFNSQTNNNIMFNSQMNQSNFANSVLNSSIKTNYKNNNFILLQSPRNIYNNYNNEEKNISERIQNEEPIAKIVRKFLI
jgi:hypothetical protein